MEKIFAIDPGNEESAYVIWDGVTIFDKGKVLNQELRRILEYTNGDINVYHIEMIASYGMPVGKSVFETCIWIGRFKELIEGCGKTAELIYRKDVKIHHCGSMKAKDGNIRAALIDKYGGPGIKKAPGVTYGVSADMWSAFAIATRWSELNKTL